MKSLIYHICEEKEWKNAKIYGEYLGSSQDHEDGFIHFSTAEQIIASAAKHRAGQTGLLLLTVKSKPIAAKVKWEKSRAGDLFPHLYGALPIDAVLKTNNLEIGADGKHIFPKELIK